LGGIRPDGFAFDSVNDCLYVAEHGNGVGGNTISVINATSNKLPTKVSTAANSAPAGLAFDPVNGNMYVAGEATNSIIVTSPTLTATYLAPPTGSITSSSATTSVSF